MDLNQLAKVAEFLGSVGVLVVLVYLVVQVRRNNQINQAQFRQRNTPLGPGSGFGAGLPDLDALAKRLRESQNTGGLAPAPPGDGDRPASEANPDRGPAPPGGRT